MEMSTRYPRVWGINVGRQSGKVWIGGLSDNGDETDDTAAMTENELESDDDSNSGAITTTITARLPPTTVLYEGKGKKQAPAKLCSRVNCEPIEIENPFGSPAKLCSRAESIADEATIHHSMKLAKPCSQPSISTTTAKLYSQSRVNTPPPLLWPSSATTRRITPHFQPRRTTWWAHLCNGTRSQQTATTTVHPNNANDWQGR